MSSWEPQCEAQGPSDKLVNLKGFAWGPCRASKREMIDCMTGVDFMEVKK